MVHVTVRQLKPGGRLSAGAGCLACIGGPSDSCCWARLQGRLPVTDNRVCRQGARLVLGVRGGERLLVADGAGEGGAAPLQPDAHQVLVAPARQRLPDNTTGWLRLKRFTTPVCVHIVTLSACRLPCRMACDHRCCNGHATWLCRINIVHIRSGQAADQRQSLPCLLQRGCQLGRADA